MTTTSSSDQCTVETMPLPIPGPGTHREITVIRYGERGIGPKIYIQTALHADEIPGMLLLHHYRKHLETALSEGRLRGEFLIVPVANPIGMAQRLQGKVSGRLDLNNGLNFNRHYPDLVPRVCELIESDLNDDSKHNDQLIRAALKQAVAELPGESESDAFRKILLGLCADADYCMDLHCDSEAVMYMYSGGTHPDIADSLSVHLGCRAHLVDDTNSVCFDGAVSLAWLAIAKRFPDYPINPGCMGCTLELRGSHDVSDEMASLDAQNLFNFFISQGIVHGDDLSVPEPLCSATPLLGQSYVRTPVTGVVSYKVECGANVVEGDTVATITDPIKHPDNARTVLVANNSGIVFKRSHSRMIEAGHIVVGIAGKEIIPEQIGMNLLSD